MKWTSRAARLLTGLLLAAGFLLAAVGIALAADAPDKAVRGRRAKRLPAIRVGQMAPDFELPLLKEQKGPKGEKLYRISKEKIKLSSFRGKKVVCLFMSSYT